MKPPSEWEEEEVLDLIKNQITESSSLEFKGCDALRINKQSKDKIISEISKDVSSFANADGGTIIYGVIEANHIPTEIDTNPFTGDEITKEWLEDIIDSNIKRKIDGLKIKQIGLKKSNVGKLIYVISISQSLTGPHQAKDYRYYQRRNFKVEPMEDYQIRDVMNRYTYPILDAIFDFANIKIFQEIHEYGIGLTVGNIGNVTANHFGIDIYLDANFIKIYIPNYDIIRTMEIFRDEKITIGGINYSKLIYRNYKSSQVNLFPGESISILSDSRGRLKYVVNKSNFMEIDKYKLGWTLFADNMPPRTGEVFFKNIF